MKNRKLNINYINETIKDSINTNEISDGYHTFGELYKHRIHIFIALCKQIINIDKYVLNTTGDNVFNGYVVIKSKKHFDGEELDGSFIIQLETPVGQISYHLPNEYWDKCNFIETVENANEWDGHLSSDVLDRLLLI